MRHKMISLLLIFALVLLVSSSFGQNMKKTGTSGAAILKVAIGAKATALGTAMTTVTGDVNQVFWNPAGIVGGSGSTQVTYSYNRWIADLSHNAFAVSHNLSGVGTFAIGGMMSGVNDITANRDIQPGLAGVEYVDDPTFDFNSNVLSLSFARQFTDKLSMGVTGKYYNETIDGVGVNAFAVDFGAIYHLGYKDLTIGARIQNLGQDLEYYYIPINLPLVFSFGVSYSLINSNVFSMKGYLDAAKPLDADQMFLGGMEINLDKKFYVRSGYKMNYAGVKDNFLQRSVYYQTENVTRQSWLDTQSYSRTDEGFSLGIGMEVPYDNYKLVVDYSWSQFELMDDVSRLSVSFQF